MNSLRRNSPVTRLLSLLLCASWLGLLCGSDWSRAASYRGEPTAERAARLSRTDSNAHGRPLSGWQPSPEFLASTAPSDTTEVEFPVEEEEKTTKQLVKDIGVFVVVSAFVGYFLVKVFLEGDEEEPPPDDDGKIIPDPTLSRSGHRGP